MGYFFIGKRAAIGGRIQYYYSSVEFSVEFSIFNSVATLETLVTQSWKQMCYTLYIKLKIL